MVSIDTSYYLRNAFLYINPYPAEPGYTLPFQTV